MKITSRSAAGAGTPKGSSTGAGTAGFEAAGAAQGGGGKTGSSWSAIANEAGGGCSAQRNLNAPFVELAKRLLKPRYLKRGPQGIMRGSTQARQDGI